jgi:hypothetical protein
MILDQDNNKEVCSKFDVVFHDEVQQYLMHEEFKKFVADTALDGVRRVLAETQEKISTDYKILKNLKCKGGEPSMMTVKDESQSNPLLKNMDIQNTKTKLQREMEGQRNEQLEKEEREKAEAKALKEA